MSIPVWILFAVSGALYDHLDEVSISPLTSVHAFEACAVVIAFIAICVRLWFDMAQVIAVAEDETRMHKTLARRQAFYGTTLARSFGSFSESVSWDALDSAWDSTCG